MRETSWLYPRLCFTLGGSGENIFLLLWCPRRKSNFSLQIEGDFYRDQTRKRKLLELEKCCFCLCPLISTVTFRMTLWCKGCVLPAVLERYTTDLQTLLLWQLRSSLWWVPPGRRNIMQKPEVFACCLRAPCSSSSTLATWHVRELRSWWSLTHVGKAHWLLLTPIQMEHPDAQRLYMLSFPLFFLDGLKIQTSRP